MVECTRVLQDYLMLLDEGYGTAYERYALNRFLEDIVKRFKIKSVLELPANGIMGVPGIKSIIFAKVGCKVTLAIPSEEILIDVKKLWAALGLKAEFVVADCIKTDLPSESYDLVWNFCVFEHMDNHSDLVKEMTRLSRRYVLVETQNIFNIGTVIHSTYHTIRGEKWDHGTRSDMDYRVVKKDVINSNLKIVEIDATDMPPWPDINMKLGDVVSSTGQERATGYRPSVKTKEVDEIVKLWNDTPGNSGVVDMFELWYAIEKTTPRFLRILYAHHPYVIAEK